MKQKKRSVTVLAIILLCIGLVFVLASLILSSFNLSFISSLQFADVSHPITQVFDSILIEEIDCNVVLLPSQDGTCTVISQEVPHLFNTVSVEDGTLTVRRRDERAWHERALVFGAADPTLTVYLPEAQYDALTVRTTSGSIRTQAPLAFRSVRLKSVNGGIELSAAVKDSATLSTTSGSISAHDLQTATLTASSADGAIDLHRVSADTLNVVGVSGDVHLDDGVSARELYVEAADGNIILTAVNVTESLRIEGVSGNVAIFNTEFAAAYVETSSGNVTGTLPSEKQFDVQTASGVVLHPASGGVAPLRIRTVSGNVSFSYLPKTDE